MKRLTAFNRSAIIAEIRDIFAPLEKLLKTGDQFDYENLIMGSGFINETMEQVVILPLTADSPSVELAVGLGDAFVWPDVAPLPLHGFYALPPNECFRDIEADVPYLVQARGWDYAEMIDAQGKFVRMCDIHWSRPVGHEKPYIKMSGNVIFKGRTCSSVSTNQS